VLTIRGPLPWFRVGLQPNQPQYDTLEPGPENVKFGPDRKSICRRYRSAGSLLPAENVSRCGAVAPQGTNHNDRPGRINLARDFSQRHHRHIQGYIAGSTMIRYRGADVVPFTLGLIPILCPVTQHPHLDGSATCEFTNGNNPQLTFGGVLDRGQIFHPSVRGYILRPLPYASGFFMFAFTSRAPRCTGFPTHR